MEGPPASKVKILHVNAERNWAGGEAQNFLLMQYLNHGGYPVYLACPPKSALGKCADEAGYKVVRFKMRNYIDIPAIVAIRRYLKRERFHIVHLHTSRAHVLAGIAAYLAGVPVVIVTRRMDYPLKKYFFTKFLYETIVDRVVAISLGVKKAILKGGISEKKIQIIPSGIPMEKFDPRADGSRVRGEFHISEDAPVASVVASFHLRKGHRYFLETVEKVALHLPQARFLLVGEGPLKENIMSLSRAMGIADSVVFTGKRSDMVDILAASDVLAMPSLYEGLGVSILEAMAMAKPVVATDVGGIPEIVQDGVSGFLVPPKDATAMAEKLLFLLQDRRKAQEMGKRGREVVSQEFSALKMAQENEKLYQCLLREKGVVL